MLEIGAVFAVLLTLSTMAGYVCMRLLGRGLPSADRLALTPLAGAALIGLIAVWIHCFFPFRGLLVFVPLAPSAAGVVLLIYDAVRRTVRLPSLPVVGLWAAASVLVLIPFIVLGGPTTFGLYSNDGFWWTIADHIVQNTTQNGTLDSNMVQRSTAFRRFGANYLSVIAQQITGLRSWETVHLTGAFGLFLLVQSSWVLARTFRLWWPMALVVALTAAGNHFQYRTFLDALVGFQFGIAFLIAVLALAFRPAGSQGKHRGALIALLVAGIGTYFTEFLVLAGALIGAGFAGVFAIGQLKAKQVQLVALSGLAGVVVLGPLVINLISHIGFIAGFQIPVPHYRWDWLDGNLLHFAGMMDHAQYSTGPAAVPVQYVGVAAVAILLLAAIRWSGVQRWLPLGAVLLLLVAAFRFFVGRNQEYTAHRFAVLMAPFAIILLFGFLRPGRKAWLLVAAVAVVCGAYPAYRMVNYLPGNYIRVTDYERQIGEEWIPKYVQQGRLLIDLPEDLNLFYGHYMYWEANHGFRNDEARIVYSGPIYSMVPPTKIDTGEVKYVLRRKGLGSAVGPWRVAALNDRYELLELRSAGELAMIQFKKGFHGLELWGATPARWMEQDGQLVVSAPRPLQMRFSSVLQPSPRVPSTVVNVTLGGARLAEFAVPGAGRLTFDTAVPPGETHIVFHSSAPPLEPGNGDARKMSVLVADPLVQVSGL